jgi:hypothetical protein
MFSHYRAGHEVDARFKPLASRVLAGEVDADSARVRAALRRRSWRFHLDVDVGTYLSPFAGELARIYPDAKFVLLIRDCFSWLNSRIERQASVPSMGASPYFAARYMRYNDSFATEEAALREAGLRPIASYFRSWAETSDGVLDSVPDERLLVVRTEDLNTSTETLARFVGVPPSTVRPAHVHRTSTPKNLLDQVPVPFIVEQAHAYCGPLMERYWGANWPDLRTRLRGGTQVDAPLA